MIERPSRCVWTVYWAAMLFLVTSYAPSAGSSSVPNIVIRKFFHFVAVAMFAPVILCDVSSLALLAVHLRVVHCCAHVLQLQLMRIAFVVATMAIVFAEFMRIVRLPSAGVNIHKYMGKYIGAALCGSLLLTISCCFTSYC